MADIGHFMIPADNADREKHFYPALPGWVVEPVRTPGDPTGIAAIQYHDVSTGVASPGTMNTGGLYNRQMNECILDFVVAGDIHTVLASIQRLGGRITMPKEDRGCRAGRDDPEHRRK
jgi:uncharacterized protein